MYVEVKRKKKTSKVSNSSTNYDKSIHCNMKVKFYIFIHNLQFDLHDKLVKIKILFKRDY